MFKLKTQVLMATDFAACITERTHALHASYCNTVGATHGNRQVHNGETQTPPMGTKKETQLTQTTRGL